MHISGATDSNSGLSFNSCIFSSSAGSGWRSASLSSSVLSPKILSSAILFCDEQRFRGKCGETMGTREVVAMVVISLVDDTIYKQAPPIFRREK